MSVTLKSVTYLGCYFLSWTIAYILTFILRGESVDFGFFDYFFLGWTFQGFELPTIICFQSLLFFAAFSFGLVPYFRHRFSSKVK